MIENDSISTIMVKEIRQTVTQSIPYVMNVFSKGSQAIRSLMV